MKFDINKAMYDSNQTAPEGVGNSFFQKMFNDQAPTIGYISSKASSEMILVPPHVSHGASTNMTGGYLRGDDIRGTVPTLGQYGLDWAFVYRKIGNNPDPKKRKDILAINMVDGDDGVSVQAEGDWGRGYKSPMYILRDYLWRTGGGHKYDKLARRSLPSIKVDTSTDNYRRALELVPIDGNDLNSPLGRATRTLFLQVFLLKTAGINYTTNEDGQPCWPKHKIMMMNQVSAIKSRLDAKDKEGFYDAFFERTDGIPLDMQDIRNKFGEISEDQDALAAWEAGFLHSDFASNQKLVTFDSYSSGPAGIATYRCSVTDVSTKYGPDYRLPDDLLKNVRPFSDYILTTNQELQTQWLQELFEGDEWALIGSGVLEPNSVRIAVPEMPSPVKSNFSTPPAPIAAVRPPAPSTPIPTAVVGVPNLTPRIPSSLDSLKFPGTPSTPTAPSISEQMRLLANKHKNKK